MASRDKVMGGALQLDASNNCLLQGHIKNDKMCCLYQFKMTYFERKIIHMNIG